MLHLATFKNVGHVTYICISFSILGNKNNTTIKLCFLEVILIYKVDIFFKSATIQRIKTSEDPTIANSDIFQGLDGTVSASRDQ